METITLHLSIKEKKCDWLMTLIAPFPEITLYGVALTKEYIFLPVDFKFHQVACSEQWNVGLHEATKVPG